MEKRQRAVEDMGGMNILHIATHLGGGAGKAISGVAIKGQEMYADRHQILLLQRPQKWKYVEEYRKNGVLVSVWDGGDTTLQWADMIVVSWWNHPAMVGFLQEFPPEKMPFKTNHQNRDTFTVGYVETLNYGKIHPNFTSYCEEVYKRIPEVRFVLVGDRDAALKEDIRQAGLEDRFVFHGYVTDAPTLMCSFDVFGYLLNPKHYGTTENVLLEIMACELPVVALRQNVEQFIMPPVAGYWVQGS